MAQPGGVGEGAGGRLVIDERKERTVRVFASIGKRPFEIAAELAIPLTVVRAILARKA